MKRITLILMCLALIGTSATAQRRAKKKANKETAEWHYELENLAVGNNNTKVIKVWSYSKKADVARDQAPKNAVHGIIFRGAAENTDKRLMKVLPLTDNIFAMDTHKDFFDNFFGEGGDYRRYVTVSEMSPEVRKIGRRQYKVGVIVNIDYNGLRKALETASVIKSLSSGF